MRNFIAGAFVATAIGLLIVAFAGCGTWLTEFPKAPQIPPALTPIVTDCKDKVEANFVGLVADALAGSDYEFDLANLVSQTSLCAVRVAVQKVIDEYKAAKASIDAPVLNRGYDWLDRHRIRPVQGTEV